jgi:hypothetical protein
MTKISDMQTNSFKELQKMIRDQKDSFTSYEDAAQEFMGKFYEKFSDSVVLSRIFLTAPYSKLPLKNKQFVDKLTQIHSLTDLVNDNTLILSLVGSAGLENEWHDRKNSKNHVGIPLASADFIDEVPMMSRLLKQLGLNLNYIASDDTKLVKHTLGRMNGVFLCKRCKD